MISRATPPAPSPAAVALLAQCRRAKAVADTAPKAFAKLPAPVPAVTAAGGEVRLVVRPQSLKDWARWTATLDPGCRRRELMAGGQMVVIGTHRGVRTRLIGVGVPALMIEARRAGGARRG